MAEPRPLARPLDRFADLLAESAWKGPGVDGNISDVARKMGVPASRARNMLDQLRAELGRAQAK